MSTQFIGDVNEAVKLMDLGRKYNATKELNALANVLKELRETETLDRSHLVDELEEARTAVLKRIQELTK